MRYHIDTIPIWDAFKTDCECPLCKIYDKCETEFISSALGGSVMEPDTRIEVNKNGFCQTHLTQLYAQQNRLGLALMAHSHLKDLIGAVSEQAGKLEQAMAADEQKSAIKRAAQTVAKNAPYLGQDDSLTDLVYARTQSCFICNRLKTAMARYVETVAAMYVNETEFARAFEGCKGFCLEHFADLAACGRRYLSGKQQRAFLRALLIVELDNLARIEQELEWYTLKFDYRNADKPWGNSRDAVERTLAKLRQWKKP